MGWEWNVRSVHTVPVINERPPSLCLGALHYTTTKRCSRPTEWGFLLSQATYFFRVNIFSPGDSKCKNIFWSGQRPIHCLACGDSRKTRFFFFWEGVCVWILCVFVLWRRAGENSFKVFVDCWKVFLPYQGKYPSIFFVSTTVPDGNRKKFPSQHPSLVPKNKKTRVFCFVFKISSRPSRRLLKGTRWVQMCHYHQFLTDPFFRAKNISQTYTFKKLILLHKTARSSVCLTAVRYFCPRTVGGVVEVLWGDAATFWRSVKIWGMFDFFPLAKMDCRTWPDFVCLLREVRSSKSLIALKLTAVFWYVLKLLKNGFLCYSREGKSWMTHILFGLKLDKADSISAFWQIHCQINVAHHYPSQTWSRSSFVWAQWDLGWKYKRLYLGFAKKCIVK